MRRFLLSTLSLAVIAVGGTALTAQEQMGVIGGDDSDWRRCFDDCRTVHSYDYCKADCKAFEPQTE